MSSVSPVGPTAFRSTSFDYASLPALEPVSIQDLPSGGAFEIVHTKDEYVLRMDGDLVAEVAIGDYRFFRSTDGAVASPRSPAPGAENVCGHPGGPTHVVWQGYVEHSGPKTELSYYCFEGSFDAHACQAKAERAWKVVAPSILPSVFAFKSIDGACTVASNALIGHEEVLELVGPRAMWVGSTTPRAVHDGEINASFSRVTLPVWQGGSSSAVLDVTLPDGRIDVGSLHAPVDDNILSYSFDVVWPASEPGPYATAFVSSTHGDAAKLAPPPRGGTYEYDFSSE